MTVRPTGTVTFLFTDIECSTRLAQEFPGTFQTAVNIHHTILQNVIESNRGFVFEIVGDAFCCAFETANDAVNAAVEVNLALAREKWEGPEIKIRTGIHSGKAEWSGLKYLGYITLARSARVMSAAYGEQILISNDTYKLLDLQLNPQKPEMKLIKNENSAHLGLQGKPEISFRDLGERRLKDLMQPIRLFQVTAPDIREEFPPLKTLDPRRNNLPVQVTSFIGRKEEIENAKELLKHSSLLTLTGTGGSGKTRLALKIAADVIDEYNFGVWIFEFESLSENSHLANSIAKVLGVTENPKITVEEHLIDYIKDREMLLIFDNCEHVINAAAILAYKLISNCPGLKIIATSREALRCEGEKIFQVSSLKYPESEKKISTETLNKYESARLFIERATSSNPHFSIKDEDTAAIAGICNKLEGIPLAIELAAARVKTLSIEQIYKRLDDRFSLLTAGYRTALPRQQTLRALINWSYELLNEKEKTLWNRLCVFSGGWTLEASEEICTDEIIIKTEMIELLEALVEKSIIIFNAETIRYRMLESIKQFGAEKLKDENELDYLSERHFIYYAELTIAAGEKLKGDEIITGLKILDNEYANVMKALEWSVKSYRNTEAANLVLSLRTYWEIRGMTLEGLDHYESIRKMFSDDKDAIYYKVITAAGVFHRFNSDFKTAEKLFEESLNFYREISDEAGIAESLKNLGQAYYFRGEYMKASVYYNESLAISNALDNKRDIADLLNFLGNVSFHRGDYTSASDFFQKSLKIKKQIGDISGTAISLNGMGLIELDLGNYSAASGFFEESLSIYQETGYKTGIGVILNNLGAISYGLGDYIKASEYYEESMVIKQETGDKRGKALLLSNLGSIYYDLGDYNKTHEFYEESLNISRDIGDKSMVVLSLNSLASVVSETDFRKAAGLFEESLAISREIGEKSAIADSLHGLGTILIAGGMYDKALENIKESFDIRNETGNKRGMGVCYNSLAKINFARGEYPKAKQFYDQSLKISRELGDRSGIANTLTGISSVLLEEGEMVQALNFLNESISISSKSGDKKQTSVSLYYLGLVFLKENNFEDARKYFTESLILRKELGNRFDCVSGLLALAVLRVNSMDYEPAVKLLSFVKKYVESNKLALYKSEQTTLEKSILELKEKMSAEDFSKNFEIGKSLTLEEAMELAVNNL